MNRETWLQKGATELRKIFKSAGYTIPDFQVSIGLPAGGCHNQTMGECYSSELTGGEIITVFISPKLSDPIVVLATLLHEMIHVENDVQDGHNSRFARIAREVGLAGRPTATFVSPALYPKFLQIARKLGPYPHAAMDFTKEPKQQTYMIKLLCSCGYLVRTTQTHLDRGLPLCPNGHKLEPQ